VRSGDQLKIYIALFRGLNVGGKNILPMKELVAVLEDLGCRHIKTYIQSENAVFLSNENDASRLSNRISGEIRKRRGFEPKVLLLELEDIERAITENPFAGAETNPKALHVGFLASAPRNPNLKILESLKKDSERFLLIDKVFYLYAPEGVGRSKLARNAENLLGVMMTDRNWRTVTKIYEIAKQQV
jgi:uncharacterized protein (DUF1697 family)